MDKIVLEKDDLELTYVDFSEAHNNKLVKIVQESKISKTNAIWLDIEQTKKTVSGFIKIF